MVHALLWASAGTGFTTLMTTAGAAMVFFFRRPASSRLHQIMLGFAAGVMIASSIANYTIISLAGYITKVGGSGAPRMILLLNMGVTFIGILLALFVKIKRNKTTVSA